ncbi:MAG: hypothetical protein HYX63_06245 [Gammaproteobacteria bacterium]|nr:hypothetical protein [Gammaproteobacteria bacterium]
MKPSLIEAQVHRMSMFSASVFLRAAAALQLAPLIPALPLGEMGIITTLQIEHSTLKMQDL